MSVYERVEQLRKERGLSQRELEQKCGFSNGSISKWKKHEPTTARLEKVADLFGVSLEYLMTGKSKEYYINDETAKVAQELFENKNLRALFDVSKDLGPDDLTALHTMALALKGKERRD